MKGLINFIFQVAFQIANKTIILETTLIIEFDMENTDLNSTFEYVENLNFEEMIDMEEEDIQSTNNNNDGEKSMNLHVGMQNGPTLNPRLKKQFFAESEAKQAKVIIEIKEEPAQNSEIIIDDTLANEFKPPTPGLK